MPLILTQKPQLAGGRGTTYEDVEGFLYHFPSSYRRRFDDAPGRFIYYRPKRDAEGREDAGTYFGHGTYDEPYVDVRRPDHYFVNLRSLPFPRLVPIRRSDGLYIETLTEQKPQSQNSVRTVSDVTYWRILVAADVADRDLAVPDDPSLFVPRPIAPPLDPFRPMIEVPPGAGYHPHPALSIDRYEGAALQERARADHQDVLTRVVARVHEHGGSCMYNNNVDLLAQLRGVRLLVEAKSVVQSRTVIDRMRYGIGQLADYAFRYRAELAGAAPVLAFGAPPPRDAGWIADVLQDQGIGFLARDRDGLVPLNDAARSTPLFLG